MAVIYLIAGEPSGDVLGARVMRAIAARHPDIRFAGIGGAAMEAEGLKSLFPMHELSLMGILEVLPQLLNIRARMRQTIDDIAARRPDIVVTIDAPDFALRVLRAIAPLGIRRAHYVAPQAWAWRQGRVKHYPGLWDRLLCLLPFEPEFFASHGLPAVFVGHPVLESRADTGDADRFRARHGLSGEARVLTVMPGSRRSEVSRLLPVLGQTMRLLPAGIVPVVPVGAAVADMVRSGAAAWPVPPVLVEGEQNKHDAFAASAAALTKSGTSTLELALAGVPMVVTYRVHPLTAAVAKRTVRVKYASLLNIIADREVLPELIQQQCTPDRLAGRLIPLLNDPAAAALQRTGAAAALDTLRPDGGLLPSEAAAESILELL